MQQDTRQLKKTFLRTLAVLLLASLACGAVTYAWYVFNASRHVTDVKMAAGTGVTFLISNEYDGNYKTSAGLSFQGLLNPVSTDNVENGFQKVEGFQHGGGTGDIPWLANAFGQASYSDYYETHLYLCTNSSATDVYVSDISYIEQDAENPISTALRVGLLVHAPGQNQPVVGQYVFEVSSEKNPHGYYNTLDGTPGCVLDSTKGDGTTVPFSPLGQANYAHYDESTGEVSTTSTSVKLCTLPSANEGAALSTPVQVDVYVWLEGCDEDCTNNIAGTSLQSLSLHFAGTR